MQARTWPRIASGAHVLATAPTGSGKTLTAFLWSLDQFATGAYRPGRTRVLYVSPLKALNNDIQRNLLGPLGELRERHGFPEIGVRTRSGDTPQGDRQRMLRNPPEILITTPESLTLLLTNPRGRQALSTVKTLILDEVHAVVANRRGAQLMTSVERLAAIAGEFQRIALSATVKPLEVVASYIGGLLPNGAPRSVEIVAGREQKAITFGVRFPEDARNAAANGKKIWDPLCESFRGLIEQNRSTLFFTNSRRLAEKITLKINEDQGAPLAYAHHGSLAREIRTEVEERLKAGELGAIVATSSLELGIDIGDLDEVVLVQSPPSVAATLQRIGRAGHRVGEVSRGTLYPTHALDFLEAAVLADAVAERDIEPLAPLSNPLDVLCQTIVSMCATETWGVEAMFALIRTSSPFRNLPREHFDLVLDMLAGRYAGTRVRELKPRIAHDRINATVRANKGALFALYNSGGTIPDRGYFQLRHADSGALVGELDEEFVWEVSVGQTFNLGTQNWQIQRITHNEVLVRGTSNANSTLPFWRAESFNRSFHFSRRIAEYLEQAEQALADGRGDELEAALQDPQRAGFDAVAADELLGYLKRQRASTRTPLPHRHHLLLELVRTGPGGYRGPDAPRQLVIHTFWGGAVNRPWALALEAAWRARFDTEPDIHADNNAVVVQLKVPPARNANPPPVGDRPASTHHHADNPDGAPHAADHAADDAACGRHGENNRAHHVRRDNSGNHRLDPEALLSWVTSDNLDELLRQSLEGSGFFGARFRECAARALLLTRQRFNQRLPLWMSRMQAKKLMTATKRFRDFPVLLEAWRSCLVDEFDLRALRGLLNKLRDGTIDYSLVETDAPSPFAATVTFDQVSRYMYADDTPEQSGASALGSNLIAQAVGDESLRPQLRPAVVEEFEAKRQRRTEGYRPQSVSEWLEWAKERVLIPTREWPADIEHEYLVRFVDGERVWVAHLETARGLADAWLRNADWTIPGTEQNHSPGSASGHDVSAPRFDDSQNAQGGATDLPEVGETRSAVEFAQEILSFYGPRTLAQLELLLPSVPDGLLGEAGGLVCGRLVEGSETIHYCDAENLQTLLRFQRAANRAEFTAQPLRALPGFWATWQRLQRPWSESGALSAIEQLSGYVAPAHVWLHDFMACRFTDFADHLLDDCFTREQFAWRGLGNRRITLGFAEDLALVKLPQDQGKGGPSDVPQAAAPQTVGSAKAQPGGVGPLDAHQAAAAHSNSVPAHNLRAVAASLFTDRNASYGYHQLSDQAIHNSHVLLKGALAEAPKRGDSNKRASQPTSIPVGGRAPQAAESVASLRTGSASPNRHATPTAEADAVEKSRIPRPPELMDAQQFNTWWWGLVWNGVVTADTLAPLRAGLRQDFRLDAPGARSPRRRARAVARGWPGNWRLVDAPATTDSALERLEDDKERVRNLAERYGVLNREIVNRETRWAGLFKAIRIMELAGELMAGHFFQNLSGPQFITPRALHKLRSYRPPQSFWLNATDPAAPCGLAADWPELPKRMPGNYLSFCDGELALVIENQGARLTFHVPPDHPDIDSITAPVQYLTRIRRRIAVDTINGENARRSPYLDCLERTMTRTSDHRRVYFEAG